MTKIASVLLACIFLVVPLFSFANGLVPCGGIGEQPCQSCDVVNLVNNVIEWLVVILGTIAALVIIYAGVKLVTSGGNQAAMESAKSMITNIIIGYIIVLSGWLLIDFGMKAVIDEGTFGVWNAVQCKTQPVAKDNGQETLNFIAQLSSGVVTNQCIPLPNGGFNCNEQVAICTDGNGVPTVNHTSVDCQYSGGVRPPDLSAGGACNTAFISPSFGNQTGNAQCVIRAESACGARNVSRTDVMSIDGRPFSFGPMQINLTVHELRNCSGHPALLDCKSAFSGRNYSARVINEPLYQECARAAQETTCNIKNGYDIYRISGWGAWSTAKGCGLI